MRSRYLLAAIAPVLCGAPLPDGIAFRTGPINTVTIGAGTAVYGVPAGAPNVTRVLLTHPRRDAISLPGRTSASKVGFVVPASARELFENPSHFWSTLETTRFHDYAQQGTKVPIVSIPIAQAVSGGDTLREGASRIRVIDTPGYAPGAVSYIIEAGGKRIACTGDLIYGDGQLFDLYSLQDAVPDAKARGYHGYAARAAELIGSLRKIAAARPDVILPARGPAIDDPQASINRLVQRLQAFLASHFEVDALRWYWGDENHRVRSRAVERPMDIMAMAEQDKLPADILAIGNSRLLLSRTGAAFLVDAGYKNLLPELKKLRAGGRIKSVDGIWITHYHDDHTDYINDVTAEFGAPVYFTSRMKEVLERPGAFRLPCLTTRPVPVQGAKRDGETLRWHEWQFTFWYFPGQTLYHGGLVAKRDDGQTFLFTGDSFTPSGMDDYCMQNRVILRADQGYDFCLRRIASLPRNTWLINQHVAPLFRYSAAQIDRMQKELVARSAALQKLSPWPDINYMVDESWARIHPYGSAAGVGQVIDLELRIMNHAPERVNYRVKWNVPAGWTLVESRKTLTLNGRQEGAVRARMRTGSTGGLHIVTADISFDGHELEQWTEALVRVNTPGL
jgi:glyoxylase-like metal-dependent hydrolase (beta-lactamase superfamily II)